MKKFIKFIKRITYRWGIQLCNSNLPEYGGYNHWLSNLLDIDYLSIGFCFKIGLYHDYYDGYHHCLYLGIFAINWGGRPYRVE